MFDPASKAQSCFQLYDTKRPVFASASCGKLPQLKTTEWPPCFDGNGALYIFDGVSSMFYEPRSNFFYDPKTSLYYGNEKKAYYRYNSMKSPPFEEVLSSNDVKCFDSSVVASSVVQGMQANAAEYNLGSEEKSKNAEKASIVINLKSKSKPTKSSLSGSAMCVNDTRKAQIANIEKWSKLSEAARIEQAKLEARREAKKADLVVKQLQQQTAVSETMKRTTRGEPICVICMRKFPTTEKLRLHEAASQLHKDNMKKRMHVGSQAQNEVSHKHQEKRQRTQEGNLDMMFSSTVGNISSTEMRYAHEMAPENNIGNERQYDKDVKLRERLSALS